MSTDTTIIGTVIEDRNSFDNPYTFLQTDDGYLYRITSGNRMREFVLLLDPQPRIMVTRYSREGFAMKEPGEIGELGPDPAEFTRMDSVTVYREMFGDYRPLRMTEIMHRYAPEGKDGAPDERHEVTSIPSGNQVSVVDERTVNQVMNHILQERRWDNCFVREFKEMLEKHAPGLEENGIIY